MVGTQIVTRVAQHNCLPWYVTRIKDGEGKHPNQRKPLERMAVQLGGSKSKDCKSWDDEVPKERIWHLINAY